MESHEHPVGTELEGRTGEGATGVARLKRHQRTHVKALQIEKLRVSSPPNPLQISSRFFSVSHPWFPNKDRKSLSCVGVGLRQDIPWVP